MRTAPLLCADKLNCYCNRRNHKQERISGFSKKFLVFLGCLHGMKIISKAGLLLKCMFKYFIISGTLKFQT